MKNIKRTIALTIFLLILSGTWHVYGSDIVSLNDFDLSSAKNSLSTAGYSKLSGKEFINYIITGNFGKVFVVCKDLIYEKTIGDTKFIYHTLGEIIIVIILSAFFTNFTNVFTKNNVSETAFYICYLVVITIIITLFNAMSNTTVEFVKLIIGFLYGIIPGYFLSVAITGQITAAGFYQFTLVVIGVAEFVFLNVIIPLIKIYVAIGIVNNVSAEDFLSKTADVIKNIINFLIKFFIGIVTGLNIIQALVLPAIDGAKNTTIRKFVGSMPVIGDGADALTGVVLGSVNLIKNTIGTFAIIAILILCMVPFLKIQIYSLSVQITTALVQPIADKRITGSLSILNTGIKMLSKIIIGTGVLFILSIAIICMVTGKE